MDTAATRAGRVVGRYCLFDEIASGGMAAVHLGRLMGPVGFARTVAIKQLHAHYAKDPEFVSMFLDEARLAARIHHPNVVSTLDVVALAGELFLVMEYVHGESLFRLLRATTGECPPNIVAAVIAGALHGLHAAHEARTESGSPLGIVHRDISPQNIIVGADGVARVLDFGVAKASHRIISTQDGSLKGKLRYMAPEQVSGQVVTRRTDIYAMAVVMYEMITRKQLFQRGEPTAVVNEIMTAEIRPPSGAHPALTKVFDDIVIKGLARDPEERWEDARTMALAIEDAVPLASPSKVGAWVASLAQDVLTQRMQVVSRIESSSARLVVQTPATEIVPAAPASSPTPSSPALSSSPSIHDVPSGTLPSSFAMPSAVPGSIAQPRSRAIPLVIAGFASLAVLGGALILLAQRSSKAAAAPALPSAAASISVAAATAPPLPIESTPPVEPAPPPTSAVTAPSATTTSSVKPVGARPAAIAKPAGTGKGDDNVFRTRR